MSPTRTDEAVKVLAETRDRLGHDAAEPTLRISLTREYAHLTDDIGNDSWRDYARELEDELWEMRQTRMNTLKTRLANTQLSREHGAISQQALQDPLTGLPNRRALDRNLDKLLEQSDSQPLSVALVDLDGFKTVNDRASHAEGDEVLRVVARTLSDTLRSDDLVSRYGGDEFAVIAEHADGAGEAFAEHAREVAGWPMRIGGTRIRPGLRISWVTSDGNASVHSVLTRAEQQLCR